jgi:aminoglycoside phosphotransferase (APT) family kinase protein
MSNVITDVTDITAARLTAILQEAGVLTGEARVASIRAESHENFFSRVHTLYPAYKGAAGSPPKSLFLKVAPSSFALGDEGRAEVAFYRMAPADLPVPRPYDVRYDEGTGQYHLLLADLKHSHRVLESGLPPRLDQMAAAITALAQIHARWWGQADVLHEAQVPGVVPPDFTLETRDHLTDFLAQFDDTQLTTSQRRAFQRAAERADHLAEAANSLPQTLTHGDSHFWNMLFPRGPEAGVYVVDWDTWGIAPSSFDLAYTLAVFLGALRGRVERDLLSHYVGALQEAGVRAFGVDDAWYGYRLGVIKMLFWPVWWWHTDHTPGLWWPRLQNILRAYEELDCEALLA